MYGFVEGVKLLLGSGKVSKETITTGKVLFN
jgi:hypothetical protein